MIDPSARSASAHVIPAVRPDVGPEESAAVAEVLLSGSTQPGRRVDGPGRPLIDGRAGLLAGTIVALAWLIVRRLR